ncbi:secretion protein [Burkholderia stagnalis]|uniref:secretion protein n=1 Tax=Burkholderia stagnalis TaxID=1503054 RepID=UPI00075B6EFF|nr:secretion protein [Burkholderia stagnalis]KVN02772.1 secretion protein [Burkholderia stagnalis]KWE06876.1 secretion protein [Burkholderia stagnalis]KWE11635.1 secretion protein [Burkholderia stagnalis]KWO72875.1 secretion protein [Burkholderia stagnalis]
MTRRAAASAAALALALAGHAPALHAVPLTWPLARFDYRVGPVNAADALSELSRRSGVAIDLKTDTPCRFDARDALPPQRFVDRVAQACGLASYYDGAVLQLVAPAAFERAAVRLNYATLAELRATLARQRIADARWQPGYDDAARIVRVAGPPRYVALALSAARALDEAAQARVRTETRAFRLRTRTAADRLVSGEGDDAPLPGLATRLRRRFEQDGLAPRAVPGVREFTATLPIVDADARSNTVLIRDVPARLARDARLVAQLDTLPAPIRIDAFGATLAPARLDALGLRWRDGTQAPGAPRVAIAPAPDGCAPARARIAELAAHGDASIDADGSTLTLPDGSADFGRLRQAFVPSGDGDARSLDAQRNGFAMRITPHETAQAGRYALDLRIVERWASGGAPSRDTVSDVTLSAGECAALALPPADGRGEQRLVLVTPRVAPPPASPIARAPATVKPAPRTHAPSRAHPSAGLGLSTQTRLLGN